MSYLDHGDSYHGRPSPREIEKEANILARDGEDSKKNREKIKNELEEAVKTGDTSKLGLGFGHYAIDDCKRLLTAIETLGKEGDIPEFTLRALPEDRMDELADKVDGYYKTTKNNVEEGLRKLNNLSSQLTEIIADGPNSQRLMSESWKIGDADEDEKIWEMWNIESFLEDVKDHIKSLESYKARGYRVEE